MMEDESALLEKLKIRLLVRNIERLLLENEELKELLESAYEKLEYTQELLVGVSDPLDENDHRDRLDWAGLRLTRHGHKHWHHKPYELPTPCNTDHGEDLSLEYWTRSIGPLTFADASKES